MSELSNSKVLISVAKYRVFYYLIKKLKHKKRIVERKKKGIKVHPSLVFLTFLNGKLGKICLQTRDQDLQGKLHQREAITSCKAKE